MQIRSADEQSLVGETLRAYCTAVCLEELPQYLLFRVRKTDLEVNELRP